MGIVRVHNDSFGRFVMRAEIKPKNKAAAPSNPVAHPETIFQNSKKSGYDFKLCEIIRLNRDLSRTLLTFSQNSRDTLPEIRSFQLWIIALNGPELTDRPAALPSPRRCDSVRASQGPWSESAAGWS